MKRALFFIITLLSITAYAAPKRGGMFIVRYEDDNSYIKKSDTYFPWCRVLKEIPLSKSTDAFKLSVGGEIRQQFFAVQNSNFGDGRPGTVFDERYLEQRYLLHTDWQLSPFVKLFTQLTSNQIAGDKNIRPTIDLNDLDLMQGFVDFTIPVFNSSYSMVLRAGRQELYYGSRRMIGFREGPSIRRAFDGIKFTMRKRKKSLDLFYLLPVVAYSGIFDDYSSRNNSVFGTYFSLKDDYYYGVEGYYIGAIRDSATYVDKTDEEHRHSVGTRAFINSNVIRLSLETTYQFGAFGDDRISAFQVAFQGRYRFRSLKVRPYVSLWADIFSGDREKNDDKNNTFRPISASPVGSSPFSLGNANLYSVKPAFGFYPLRGLSISCSANPLWRFSDHDYLYVSSVTRVKRKHRKPEDTHYVATLFEGAVRYAFRRQITLQGRVGVALPGTYTEATGKGENMLYGVLKLQYKF